MISNLEDQYCPSAVPDDGIAAEYEYGPFGEPIRATGPMADVNPFRFSTKYTDNETQLVYYGYRYYSSDQGRWLSRDPLGERGGLNLYGFGPNSPVNGIDYLGIEWLIQKDFWNYSNERNWEPSKYQ